MAIKQLINTIGQYCGLIATDLTVTGHPIIEGVTSTGATGTGKFVFDTSPALVTPALGTPTSGDLTSCTGTASGLTAGTASKVATVVKAVNNAEYYMTFVEADSNSSQSVCVSSLPTYNPFFDRITATNFLGYLKGDVNGNAGTATKLAATKTINGVAFDGSANISVPISGCSDYVAPTAWTPVLTFVTPGDLSVTYTTQVGFYCKRGSLVTLFFNIVTASFTWTTASGNLEITGLPYLANATANLHAIGTIRPSGLTHPTGCTALISRISSNTQYIYLTAYGSGAATAAIAAANTTTGLQVQLIGSIEYWV